MYMLYDNKGKIRLPNPNIGLYVVQNFLIEIAVTPVNQRAPQRVASERMTTHRERTWYDDPRLEEAASPSRPMVSTCATTRANTGDMAGEPRSPVDKSAFPYGQVLHRSIWSFRIQTSAPIWCRTILRRLLRFHEQLLPRGQRFFQPHRQHSPRYPEHASRTWTTPGRATKMEPGPRHCSTRAETRHNNNERQHHNHDEVLEHRVRPHPHPAWGSSSQFIK